MEFTTFLWTTLSAFLTLATFSFLYRDNPFYRIAEHLVVGTSAGYFVLILWHNSLVPNMLNRILEGSWLYIIPGILGAMMWTRFSKNYAWISRWPLGIYVGIAAGVAIPLEMANRVNKQLVAAMVPISWDNFLSFLPTSGLSDLIVFTGAIAALCYFFFSKAHTGAFGAVAKYGIWILMIGFGTSFGFTVMARISLFINRIQSVDRWGQAAFDTANPNYSSLFPLLFWIVTALVVGFIVVEIYKHLNGKKTVANQ